MRMRLIGVFLFAVLFILSGFGGSSAASSNSFSDSKINGIWIVEDVEGSIASSPVIKAIVEDATPEGREAVMANFRNTILIINPTKGVMNGWFVGNHIYNMEFTILSEDSEVVIVEEDINANKMKFNIIDEDTLFFEDSDGLTLILVRK